MRLARAGSRYAVPVVHLKDIAFDLVKNHGIPVELGNGTLDLPSIVKAATASGSVIRVHVNIRSFLGCYPNAGRVITPWWLSP